MFCSANGRVEPSRLFPSTRLQVGNGWITWTRVVIGVPNLIGSKSPAGARPLARDALRPTRR